MSTSSSSGEPAWAPRPLCEDGLRRRSACGHPMPDLQRDSAFKKMAFELRLLAAHGGSFKRVRRPRRTLRLRGPKRLVGGARRHCIMCGRDYRMAS